MDYTCPNCGKQLDWKMEHDDIDDTDVGGGYSTAQEYNCKCECGVEGHKMSISSWEGSSYSYFLRLGDKVYKEETHSYSD